MQYRYGMILGRFQPFHLEHLRYFRLAWEQSERVIVGITNPDPTTILKDASNRHRHLPKENPLTYIDRLMMIQTTLLSEGFPMEHIYIVPIPIHHPDRWRHYIPTETVLFVITYSEWERNKAERIRAEGYQVVEIDSFQKGISGQEVRTRFRSDGDWEELVPPAVAKFIHSRPELQL
ncbi:MAG: adenylyltransferase/cytidyltransferase family protein [Acidobacteriota bacterium]|jgi:cytidyltransferase-like protein